MDKEFIHLHLHTDYSISDGVSKCKDYLTKAKELGMSAIAVTDHGNMASHMDFQLNAESIGVKPIFGVEMYIVDDASIHDGDHRTSNHIVLLAKNSDGYRNLLRLQKKSWSSKNFYYRPRIGFKELKKFSNGLIALTACVKGLIASNILSNDFDKSIKYAKKLKKIFDQNLYLELQLHNIRDEGVNIQEITNRGILKIAKKLDIQLVVTNDIHYLNKGDWKLQDRIVKMKRETDLAQSYCKSLWLKSYDEMKRSWKKNHSYISKKVFEKAIKNTIKISNACNYKIPTGNLHIPKIKLDNFPGYKKNQDLETYIRRRIKKGLKEKGLRKNKIYLDRIEKEIYAFREMDVFSYILIFDDLIRYLTSIGCLCSLRGSANGSVVLYLMGLSFVDPIKYDIVFERFISPARIKAKMADIDIDLDISHIYRDEAKRYLEKQYGKNHICTVGTFGRMQLKAAIKNMARVEADKIKSKIENTKSKSKIKKLERRLKSFSYGEINKLTKSITDEIEFLYTTDWYKTNKKWFDKFVKPIIGNVYSESLHPAGIVVSPEPYSEWLPVRTNKLPKEKGGERIFAVQWENSHTFEEFLNERGVMVMDVLGVKTLTVISETIKLVKKRHDMTIKLDQIPTNDKMVYQTLSEGENLGFFQLGKSSLSHLLKKLHPDNIEDVIFMIAADRPGPIASGALDAYIDRKSGKEKVKYKHDSLKPILKDTLGVLTYSEHIMKTATEFAGLDPIDSEKMRKIIKSKKQGDFEKLKKKFIKGAKKKWGKKIDDLANELWDELIGFSKYAFPKAHSTAYGLIANATQYLKVHYPIEFFCSYLNQVTDKDYLKVKTIAKSIYGIKFKNPDINLSKNKIIIRKDRVLWSLSSIKGLGEKAAKEIIEKQPYSSFEDFYKRINKTKINIRVMKVLIIAGVFKRFGSMNEIIKKYSKLRGDKKFESISKKEIEMERKQIIPYSIKPMRKKYKKFANNTITFEKFKKVSFNSRVLLIGSIEKLRFINIKNGTMCLFSLTDSGNSIPVVCWPAMMKRLTDEKKTLQNGMPIKISGFKTKSKFTEMQISLGRERQSYIKLL